MVDIVHARWLKKNSHRGLRAAVVSDFGATGEGPPIERGGSGEGGSVDCRVVRTAEGPAAILIAFHKEYVLDPP
ncbi:MAG: hypothetical protein RIR52_1970 [Acidobacteriota bacterium]|jgi:hypothetical protein